MAEQANGAYLGMVLAGSRLMGRLYRANGDPLGSMVLDVECDVMEGPDLFLATQGRLTTLLLAECGLPWTSISGVGVGLPAPFKDGVIQDKANLGHEAWTKWAAVEQIRHYFEGAPVAVDNDANVLAYGEWLCVTEEHKHDLIVVLMVGNGIGGGIISDGALFRGQGGAGEFGRVVLTMDPNKYWNEEHTGTAVQQTVEYFASSTALQRQLSEKFSDVDFDPEHRHQLWEIGRTNTGTPNWQKMALEVNRLAIEGDELCLNLLKLREEAMGRLLAHIGLMFNPHIFIVGVRRMGDEGRGKDLEHRFIEGVKDQMEERLLPALPGYDYKVLPAQLGDEAGIFGAAMLARDAGLLA